MRKFREITRISCNDNVRSSGFIDFYRENKILQRIALFSCYFWTEFLKLLAFLILDSRGRELNISESSFYDTATTLDASNPKNFSKNFESEESGHIFYEHWSVNFTDQLTRLLKKRGKFIKNFLPEKCLPFYHFLRFITSFRYRFYLGENISKLHDTIATYSSEFSIDLFSKKSSFALWFQFTILNIVDYYIPRRSSIDSSRKKGGRERWKYVIGISNHWNYWNLTGKLGKTELEKVIIPAGCILSLAFFLPFFPSSFLSFLFFSFQKEYRRERGRRRERSCSASISDFKPPARTYTGRWPTSKLKALLRI